MLAVVACDAGKRQTKDPPPTPAPPVADAAPRADATPPADVALPADALTGVTVPDLGCFAWSTARHIMACAIGARSVNRGDSSEVKIVFVPLAGTVKPPESLTVLHVGEDQNRGPDELEPALARRLAASVAGFTALDRSAATMAWKMVDDRIVQGPAREVGGVVLAAHLLRDGNEAGAVKRKFDLALHSQQLLDASDTYSSIEVRAFEVAGTVIVEAGWTTGAEGMYGSYAQVWRCGATACSAIED